MKEAATKLDQFYALDQRPTEILRNSFLEVHTACGYKSAAHLNQVITDGSYVRTLQRKAKLWQSKILPMRSAAAGTFVPS